MLQRHVLSALHTGVAAGDEDAARIALGKIDWILRGFARRRFEHALIDASLATGVLDPATPEAARHRLRAAALLLGAPGASEPPADLADSVAIARAYAGVEVRPPARLPLATIAAALLAVVALIGVIGVFRASMGVVTASTGPFERPPPPPPTGVFRDGGTPPRDAAIEQLLAIELPRFLRADEPRRTARAAELRDDPAFARHGVALQTAWRGWIDTAAEWANLQDGQGGYRRVSHELRARAIALSDQLAAVQLGYYLDATLLPEHGSRPPGISTYRIEDVVFVRANTERIRVLGLRRIDQRDTVAALGMTSEELDDPVVLLGQVDEKIRYQILPVLRGDPFPLGSDYWMYSRRGRDLARTAGDAIRRELAAALGSEATTADHAALRYRRLVAGSVGRHEAQHGLDHARDLRHPQPLIAVLGRSSRLFALRARLELSAYLSQIASDTWLPQLVLWNLARHAFRTPSVSVEEGHVAMVVIEGLTRRLKTQTLPPGSPIGSVSSHGTLTSLLRSNGELDRDRLALLAAPLAEAGTLELRSAAAALWQELFGEPLVRIYDDL